MPISTSYNQTYTRFRNDDGNVADATWAASENTNVSITVDTNFRLRTKTDISGFGISSLTINLYYSLNGGAYIAIDTGTPVRFSATTYYSDNDTDDIERLTSSYSVFSGARLKESTGGASFTWGDPVVPTEVEQEWCLQLDSSQVSAGDIIDFRTYRGTIALNVYSYTPRVTATSSQSGTTHEGEATFSSLSYLRTKKT